ncbi:MAG: protein kinase [Acidobacteriota bacterium]|nr:protein kinase [Acidobacteriota bacterium]
MSLAAGQRLGPYEILAALGAGGMGEVYRARDTRLDRGVAIKVLSSHSAGDPAAAARLTREARAVAAIAHPNVLGIFDVGEHDGISFVVTELLEGTTLRGPMAAGLELGAALRYAVQIAHGLAAAHDQGIVHRDLKPENLFLTTDRRVKILDFGLARQASAGPGAGDETQWNSDTTPGVVMGTAGYMSPEQARGQAVDPRGDIFAFGAILFEMLAGRRAFGGETMADTMAAVVRDEPPDLQQLNPSVPPSVARIVARCLAKVPAERFRSAHDLALALEAISGAGPTVAAPLPPARTEKGIVVLPFENMSADVDNAFFADGLTEEIIVDLSKIHALRVISRTSAMQLKGRQGNLPSLARELNVEYVLEGSVRKSGDRLRISAQLIDAAADSHIWSEKYNGTMDDVFDIQERVARAIAEALRVKLTPEESREIAKRPIEDPAAYECYLRARSGLMTFTEEGLRRAIADIERGLAIAGENVLLLSVKGEAAWQLFNLGVAGPGQLEEVSAIARRIEMLEPGSPQADRLLALHAAHTGRPTETARRLRKVITADPSDTLAMAMLVFCTVLLGRVEAARPIAARIVELDPLESLFTGVAGWLEFMDGRFAEGVVMTTAAYQRAPASGQVALLHAVALAAAGRVGDAVAVTVAIERDAPDDKMTWFSQAVRWGLQGESEALVMSITPERRAWASVDPHYTLTLAECHALAGRPDEAFEWLEQMMRTGATPYPFVSGKDPLLSKLRTDVRWPAFIERLREAWERAAVAQREVTS